jgi:hypothetical protein
MITKASRINFIAQSRPATAAARNSIVNAAINNGATTSAAASGAFQINTNLWKAGVRPCFLPTPNISQNN